MGRDVTPGHPPISSPNRSDHCCISSLMRNSFGLAEFAGLLGTFPGFLIVMSEDCHQLGSNGQGDVCDLERLGVFSFG